MKKIARVLSVILVSAVLMAGFAAVAFAIGAEPVNTGVVAGDLYTADQKVSNVGTVQGDIIAAGQDISSSGSIEGDLLAAGMNIDLTGKVLGNMRTAGQNISISGEVGKNVTAFAQNISCKSSSTINGNIFVMGNSVDLSGIVKGKSTIYGDSVTLQGQFLGDVNVYNGDTGTLTVLPNTVIQGKLTYTGKVAANISQGATVTDFNWSKPAETPNQTPNTPIWQVKLLSFLKLIMTTILYFVLGLILFKLFPSTFNRQANFIQSMPGKAIGKGITVFALQFAFLLGFVILLVFTGFLAYPSIAFAAGFFVVSFYTALFYFAALPVALWLGNFMLKEKFSAIHRLGIGLLTIKIVVYLLGLLSDVFSPVGIIIFLVKAAVLLFGSGAILYGLKEILTQLIQSQKLESEPVIQE